MKVLSQQNAFIGIGVTQTHVENATVVRLYNSAATTKTVNVLEYVYPDYNVIGTISIHAGKVEYIQKKSEQYLAGDSEIYYSKIAYSPVMEYASWVEGGGGAGSMSPFEIQLDASDSSRLGDTTTVQSNWWGNQTYDSGFVTNIGQQSYQGYYAFTAGSNATLTATLMGACGWGNSRGRSITATFAITSGDRIVFFAGKATTKCTSGQEVGAGGGASCLMKYSTSLSGDADYANGFVPLIIAAGGSATGTNPGGSSLTETIMRITEAVPLSTSTSGLIAHRKSNLTQPTSGEFSNSDWDSGAGRNDTQTGGSGWRYGPLDSIDGALFDGEGNNAITTDAVGLAYGALGNQIPTSNPGSNGGFGGGGGDKDQNYFGAGGGGYFGGFECSGGWTTGSLDYSEYLGFIANASPDNKFNDDKLGPISFVHSSGTSVTDNGNWPTSTGYTLGSQVDSEQIGGRVVLSFS